MIIIKVTNCTHCFKFFEASKSKKKIVLKSHKQINKVYNDKLQFSTCNQKEEKIIWVVLTTISLPARQFSSQWSPSLSFCCLFA